MMNIATEIQQVSDNADKCINYPIGDKLEAFIKHQDDSRETNFALSGVVIHAAAKIFGRKVDYFEQEVVGIAKNFEAINTSDEKQPEKEMKKTRTKKFVIKDRVNMEKISFEEKPINVLAKVDINKTLATPSKIDRLQRMKEFFAKNKSRTGKMVIPKNLLFTSDNVLSNFGSTQIYDYDDHKEVVGSRRDFTSFSYFINSVTGELQSELSLATSNTSNDDFYISNRENMEICEDISVPSTPKERFQSPVDWTTRPSTPAIFREPSAEVESITSNRDKDWANLSINIDEGIEMDEVEKASMLLPIQPMVKLIDIRVRSPSLFPPDLQVNQDIDMNGFDRSILSVQEELVNNVTDFELPSKMRKNLNEIQIRNIFLIPLKKLKHKCIFDLPNEEYGELKKRKRDQHKPVGIDPIQRQLRVFKPLDFGQSNDGDPDDGPFLGFTKEQQLVPMNSINLFLTVQPNSPKHDKSPTEGMRKFSNDSGLETDCSLEQSNKDQTTLTNFNSTSDDQQDDDDDASSYVTALETLNDCDIDNNINLSGGDSCYQSLASGDSTGKADLSSFFKDIESRNCTINEIEEEKNETGNESEERVLQMQQSAINIAKWKEYLKPILAGSEARSKIDMHQYGIEMIGKIGNVNDSVTLDEITEPGKTPAFFLTMLQLINNRNIEIEHGERSMTEPVNMNNIKITLKSKILHQEKFEEMGQNFVLAEDKKLKNLKRKAAQTSTPAKRMSMQSGMSSFSFNSSIESERLADETDRADDFVLSQGSSGYCSQNSILSDF